MLQEYLPVLATTIKKIKLKTFIKKSFYFYFNMLDIGFATKKSRTAKTEAHLLFWNGNTFHYLKAYLVMHCGHFFFL